MRRTCLMLLILPAGLSSVAAADNPFSKPKPIGTPAAPTSAPALKLPEPQPMAVPLIKPIAPIFASAPVAANGNHRETANQAPSNFAAKTESPPSATLSGFNPVSMADILLAGLPTQITPPQSPSDMPVPAQLPERQLPADTDTDTDTDAEGAASEDSAKDSLDDYDYDLDDEPKEDNLLFAPSIYGKSRLAQVAGERIAIPPLIVPTTSTDKIGNKKLPDDIGGDALVMSKPLPEGFDRYEDWSLTSYFWQAPNTFSHPLYFEDPMLERHGHERFPCVTPLISGTRFFATIAMLPYLSTVQEPCDCVYTLGHFRPGTCAPPLLKRPPYERRAAIVQALSTAGYFVAWP